MVGINKPLSCLYQHEPRPTQSTDYILEILLFTGKNLLEPACSSRVYLNKSPVRPARDFRGHQ